MSRPTTLLKDATLYWVIRLFNSSGVLVDADSTPTVAVRKNGSSVGDSVTVTKRSATTGIYDCSYNPASEVEGDQFTIEETSVISSTTYTNSWEFRVTAAERGTDSAYTGTPPTAAAIASQVRVELTTELDEIGTILVDTAEIGVAGAGLSAIPWNAAWDAEVQSEATDALNAYDPPTHTEMTAAFTEIKGSGWLSSTDTLEKIRDASGSSSSVTITPLSAGDIQRVEGTTIQVFQGESITHTVASITDADGNAVTLTGKTLEVVIDRVPDPRLLTHTDFEVVAATVVSASTISFTNTALSTASTGRYRWALREPSNGNYVWARGVWEVVSAATED